MKKLFVLTGAGMSVESGLSTFRDADGLQQAHEVVRRLKDEAQTAYIDDRGTVFNQDVLGAIELGYLLDTAEATVLSAIERKESRGAHMRDDFPKRDDVNFMQHTMAYLTAGLESPAADHIRLDWKPVRVTQYEPTERKY